VGVNFRNDERNAGLQTEGGAVVDDDASPAHDRVCVAGARIFSARKKHRIVSVEFLGTRGANLKFLVAKTHGPQSALGAKCR